MIPGPEADASPQERDRHDLLATYHILENKILPMYYERSQEWWKLVLSSMNDVVPFFDSDRMATEYYENLYDAPYYDDVSARPSKAGGAAKESKQK